MLSKLTLLLITTLALVKSLDAFVIIDPNDIPHKSEEGQAGFNDCGGGHNQTSDCQTLWMNSIQDFCLWGPPSIGTVGDHERNMVAYCTKHYHGSRVIPEDTIKAAHWIETPHYFQITGTGNFTKMNIQAGDAGGELDPHGADGKGNPIGGLVLGKQGPVQYQEWTQFIGANEFCIRFCKNGPMAAEYCQHIYDVMGCYWNEPGNYDAGFDKCSADDVIPMGLYPTTLSDGTVSTSTWYQGVEPTPEGQPPASSSSCHSYSASQVNPGIL